MNKFLLGLALSTAANIALMYHFGFKLPDKPPKPYTIEYHTDACSELAYNDDLNTKPFRTKDYIDWADALLKTEEVKTR